MCLFGAITSCVSTSEDKSEEDLAKDFQGFSVQIHGHRGDRGNFPENSVPAFISAVKKGVDVLEMDVVISKDHKVVVSHEPFMESDYMLKPNGKTISEEKEVSFNLYKMPYDSIKKYDSGSKENPRFPSQKKLKTYKPLLTKVIDTVEAYVKENNLPMIWYNIEIKSKPKEYGIYQPYPEEFVKLVVEVIEQKNIKNRVIIQSFDPKVLNILHENFPEITTSYLVSNSGIANNLSLLDFTPDIYSPSFKQVKNKMFVDSIHQKDMQLVPWTVNQIEDIEKMLELEVDGVISDFPERLIKKQKISQH